jgi:hypothetical protein
MDKTITYHERAIETIGQMYAHVGKLSDAYGPDDVRHLRAAGSLAHVMSGMVMKGFADTARVTRDGDLSLYVVEGSFHYGVIWHGARRHCTVEGCEAYLNPDGTFYTYGLTAERKVCDGPHVPDYPYDAPAPGTWATHS